MVGILSYGAYIPLYRLSREELSRVWGGSYGKGERAIANCDEDSITLAVEAVINCLDGIDRESIDGLYFASTTSPYRIKRAATIVASAADLREDIFTADFTNSFGSGASALRAAYDAVASGAAERVVVVASECHLVPPNSSFETIFGDGASALLIGDKDLIATIEGRYSISSDFIDIWRKERGDQYIRTWEDRFVIEKGYMNYLPKAIKNLLKKSDLTTKDIAKFAYYGPDQRSHGAMARTLGIDKRQVQEPIFEAVGNTGSPFFLMLLISALENSKPGDRIVGASYSDGAEAFLFRVTDQIEKLKDRGVIERHLTSKMSLPNYGTYLRFRNLMEWEKTPYPDAESSLPVMNRDERALIRGRGHRCRACGHIQFPPQRVCMWCQARGQFEEVRISDKKGRIFTYSIDERAIITLDLPNVLAIVDLEGGGRVYGQLTDRDPNKVEIGMHVEFTFRKFHEGGGFHNYAWKCRPIR